MSTQSARTPALHGYEQRFENATSHRERAQILRLAARRKEMLDAGLTMDEISAPADMSEYMSQMALHR